MIKMIKIGVFFWRGTLFSKWNRFYFRCMRCIKVWVNKMIECKFTYLNLFLFGEQLSEQKIDKTFAYIWNVKQTSQVNKHEKHENRKKQQSSSVLNTLIERDRETEKESIFIFFFFPFHSLYALQNRYT